MKKLTALFLSLVLCLSLASPALAAAKVVPGEGDGKNFAKAEQIVTQANEKIADLVAHAQKTKKDDVAKLLEQVDKVVARTTQQVEKLGYTVECVYTAYEVDGQIVMIDPLRVIQWDS